MCGCTRDIQRQENKGKSAVDFKVVILRVGYEKDTKKNKKKTTYNAHHQTSAWRHRAVMESLSITMCLLGSPRPCVSGGHHSASNGCP